jgi:nucleotide-binding universal stress UspA family protein
MIALKTILVATDFSDASEAAWRYGRALAHAFGASLHVLHVVPDGFAWAGVAEAGVVSPSLYREWEGNARRRLELMLSEHERQQLRVTLAVKTGEPVREIIGYAVRQGIDLAVLGTRRTGRAVRAVSGADGARTPARVRGGGARGRPRDARTRHCVTRAHA